MQRTIECDFEKESLIAMTPRVSTAILPIRQTSSSLSAGKGGTGYSRMQLLSLTAMLVVAGGVLGEEPRNVNVREPLPIE
jgi:hypothetical protein